VLDTDFDRLRLRDLGTLLFSSRALEREESEPESESLEESELESELDPEFDVEDESESERFTLFELTLLVFFSLSFSLSLAISLASRMRSAVPLLFINSSGTSTDGFPSALNFISTPGFSSCCVRDGRDTYGRVDLHS